MPPCERTRFRSSPASLSFLSCSAPAACTGPVRVTLSPFFGWNRDASSSPTSPPHSTYTRSVVLEPTKNPSLPLTDCTTRSLPLAAFPTSADSPLAGGGSSFAPPALSVPVSEVRPPPPSSSPPRREIRSSASSAARSSASRSGSSFFRPPPRRSRSTRLAPAVWRREVSGLAIEITLGLDPLLADLLRDLRLVRDGLLAHPHPLLRHGALLDDRLLLVEHHLVLLLGDLGALERPVHVRVRDRLALDADLLATHRDRLLDLLGHHVLAEPRAATLTLGRPDPQLLLRTRHRAVRRVLGRRDRALGGVVDAVVAEELRLLLFGELRVGVHL